MPANTILVLMSTYNGERFLREQLDSLLWQEGVEVHVLVRDDGSSDGTAGILAAYADRFPCLHWAAGAHKGVNDSFLDLCARPETDAFEWFAFCDQDDVWQKDKLFSALRLLKAQQDRTGRDVMQDGGRPLVYCSALQMTDESGRKKGLLNAGIRSYTRKMALVQNIAAGCTQVFNKEALVLFREASESRLEHHDHWMTWIAAFFGRLVYDPVPHILYRQHAGNAVGGSAPAILPNIKRIFQGAYGDRCRMAEDFLHVYQGRLPRKDQFLLQAFSRTVSSPQARILIASDPGMRGLSFFRTLVFRTRVLLGIPC